jgi:predicted secreted hydrolase
LRIVWVISKDISSIPSGKIKCKNKNKWLEVEYQNEIPYVVLSENGISVAYRLDKAVYRAYHCTYDIDHGADIIHIDGNQGNCKIKNLILLNK